MKPTRTIHQKGKGGGRIKPPDPRKKPTTLSYAPETPFKINTDQPPLILRGGRK